MNYKHWHACNIPASDLKSDKCQVTQLMQIYIHADIEPCTHALEDTVIKQYKDQVSYA